VATLCFRANSRRTRDSSTVRVRGFSQKTCLPARIAAAEATACVWSGIDTTTPSSAFGVSSSIRRKSWNVLTFVSARRPNVGATRFSQERCEAENRLASSPQRWNAAASFRSSTSHSATTFAILGIVSTNQRPRPPTPMSARSSCSLAA